MKYLICLVGIFLLVFSCKKDPLEGNYEQLVGKWVWIYSTHELDFCDNDPNYTNVLSPETEGVTFSMEFYQKGIVKFYSNDEFISKHRLVFTGTDNICYGAQTGYNSFSASLDNKIKNQSAEFLGCVSGENLVIRKGFPFENIKFDCEDYTNYFVKE